MIGLTIAMLMMQEAPDMGARCRAVAVRLEGEKLAPDRLRAQHAGLPGEVYQAAFTRRVREVRAAREHAKFIRVRYPGAFLRDPEVDALAWEKLMAEARACRDGTR